MLQITKSLLHLLIISNLVRRQKQAIRPSHFHKFNLPRQQKTQKQKQNTTFNKKEKKQFLKKILCLIKRFREKTL